MSLREAYEAEHKRHRMTTKARVVTFDIERRPGLYWSWGPRADYLGRDKQVIRSSTISYAAKWYGERDVIYRAVEPVDSTFMQPEDTPGYADMIESLRDILDECDIAIGFNSIRFDEKKVLGEVARLGMRPPSPFTSLDLMRTSRRFSWDYSSLAESLDAFGLGGKLAHQGFTLWTDFMAGDPKAHRIMEKYNRQDVTQTERLADAMRPFIKDHPNLNLWAGHDDDGNPVEVCSNCGRSVLRVVPGKSAHTSLTRYALVECDPNKGGCGNYMRRNFVKARTTLRTAR